MDQNKFYTRLSEKQKTPSHKVRNGMMAFLTGGTMAVVAQGMFYVLTQMYGLQNEHALSAVVILIIMVTSLLTGLGIYDKAAQLCGAGLFIPISGFANSLTSCAMECKHEGLIFGIGSNMFKLAGSVLTYGIASAYVFGMIRFIFGV